MVCRCVFVVEVQDKYKQTNANQWLSTRCTKAKVSSSIPGRATHFLTFSLNKLSLFVIEQSIRFIYKDM